MRVIITGGSGLVGSALVEYLFAQGHTICCLQRNKSNDGLIWDIANIDRLYQDNNTVDAVIHLAGENISSGRWGRRKKSRILRSRIQGTHEIASYFSNVETPPKVMIFASAIGYYGDTRANITDENGQPGESFLAEVCKKWEDAASPATEAGIRTVFSRFGMILSPKGGALQKMIPPFKAGLGGTIGNGKQYMSWVSIRDVVSAMNYILENDDISGPVNLVAPIPITNKEFTRTLGRAVQKHTLLPLPALLVRTIFGQMGKELLLTSSRVSPTKLNDCGFTFRDATLKAALAHCVDPT